MVPHDKENPEFTYNLAKERNALLATKAHRGIPEKSDEPGLIASSLDEAGQFQKKTVFTSPANDPEEPGKIQKILKSNN